LLAPQRGLFATVESKSNRNSKSDKKQNQGILPELSNFGSHPGRAGGLPLRFRAMLGRIALLPVLAGERMQVKFVSESVHRRVESG
jgi:hypothetical protein